MMLRVVLDVNTLISGTYKSTSLPGQILRAWEAERIQVTLSAHILDRFREVASRSYFRDRIAASDLALSLRLMKDTIIVDPDLLVRGVADDEDDDLVLGTAVTANAQYLVTGDRGLLRLEMYRDVRIVTAADFLAVLSDGQP